MQKLHSQLWQSSSNWSLVVWPVPSWLFQVQLISSSNVNLFPFLWSQFSGLWQLMSWVQLGHCVVNVSVCKTAHRLWLRVLSIALEKELKGPWLCLMTTLFLFGLLWLFSFVSTFLTSLIKPVFFSRDKRQAEDMVGRGKDHSVLLCFTLFIFHGWTQEKNLLSRYSTCLLPWHILNKGLLIGYNVPEQSCWGRHWYKSQDLGVSTLFIANGSLIFYEVAGSQLH